MDWGFFYVIQFSNLFFYVTQFSKLRYAF